MSKQEAIRTAASAVKAHGLTLPADLEKQIAGLENPQYRVAVVGEYQVGKSTLINRVFLGDKPLLSEGHGLCNTAVATDIECGSEAKMEVYDWADDSRSTEILVKTVPNPTKDDVCDATVSSKKETRAELAKKRARVRIQVPNEALKGFTVIDTPGLDDPNQELLDNTTWRIIPSADVALLVVKGDKALEDRQLNFLQKGIMGKNGISRLMVLVSYKPSFELDADQRKEFLQEIKDQLASIGRDNIPVEMYCFDSAVEDILNSSDRILLKLCSYLEQNALPGREEKVANLLRAEIEKNIVDVVAQLKTAGASDAERAALAAKVDAEVARFKEKAELAFERFQISLTALRKKITVKARQSVGLVFDMFVANVESKSGAEKLKFIKNAQTTIQSELTDKISVISLELKTELSRVVDQYGKDMEEVRRQWDVFLEEEFQFQKPFMAKVPSAVWVVLETWLYTFVVPFGWIGAIIARLIGKQFFTPVPGLADWLIDKQIRDGMENSKEDVCSEVEKQIENATQMTFIDVKAAMEASNQAQVETIRAALKSESAGTGDRAALESAKVDLESVLAAL